MPLAREPVRVAQIGLGRERAKDVADVLEVNRARLADRMGEIARLEEDVDERAAVEAVLVEPPSKTSKIASSDSSECSACLEVPPDVYEVVRSELHRFLVAPGHEEPEEDVVAGAPSYLVVAMRPEAA